MLCSNQFHKGQNLQRLNNLHCLRMSTFCIITLLLNFIIKRDTENDNTKLDHPLGTIFSTVNLLHDLNHGEPNPDNTTSDTLLNDYLRYHSNSYSIFWALQKLQFFLDKFDKQQYFTWSNDFASNRRGKSAVTIPSIRKSKKAGTHKKGSFIHNEEVSMNRKSSSRTFA